MNVGIICEEKYFDKIQKLVINDAWECFQIQTRPEAWLEMKEENYSLFVVHTAKFEEKYLQFLEVLEASFQNARVCFLCDPIPQEALEQIVNQMGIAVFSLKKEPHTIAHSLKKYMDGEEVFIRKNERFRALPFVEVRTSDNSFTARTANLSLSGAEISGNISPLKEGDSIELVFKDAKAKERKVSAIIRWIKWNNSKTESQSFGVEFVNAKKT